MRVVCSVVFVLCFFAYAYAEANVLSDSGFEGSGAGEWISDMWGGQFGIDYDAADFSRSGGQSLKQWATGVTDDANGWEKSEAKQIISVQPGYIIAGGAWLKYENLNQVEAKIECKWLDSGFNELPGGIGTAVTSGSGDWTYQDLSVWDEAQRTAPEGASYVDFRLFVLAPGTAETATGTVWWDDAEFSVIPEPSSMALLIGGITGLLAFRKRRR